jgi:platelet-activating factor acetylhydrolase IB subunit beta/gamma
MRPWSIVFCTMALGFVAHAQTASPISASPPPVSATAGAPAADLPEPTSTTTPDNTRYQKNPSLLSACEARLNALDGKPCDIIFIGDSITENWLAAGKGIWDKSYAPRHALNFGVEGDKIQNVLWRLNNMDVQSLKPKVAVVMIGTNNLDNSPHEIADGIKAILQNTQADFAGVKIILVSILPNDRAQDKMMQVNSIIRSYAEDNSIYYLNLVPLMPQSTAPAANGLTFTNWKGLGKDQLQPDAAGYQIWADAMEPLLTKLLAGQ